jgi:transglutaminase-like putative cysteine protease
MTKYEEAVAIYEFVKEEVKYAFPRWIDAETTKRTGRGHCAAKSELLVSLLRDKGIKARYVEGHKTKLKLLPIMKLGGMDIHFWVETRIGNEWLCLDPTPDSGIVRLWGDTKPGMHLGDPEYGAKWDELPSWYKDSYNIPLLWPLRFLSNMELAICRLVWHFTTRISIKKYESF